jgi:hypothetical protein
MAAAQVIKTPMATAKSAVGEEKGSIGDLLGRLPLGSTLRPSLIMYGGSDEATRCWEVRHEKLSFWVVRDTPEEAIRAFIHAVDKRGLRAHLEGTLGVPNSHPLHEQNIVPKPAVI